MAKKTDKVTDLVILSELEKKITEAAGIAPVADVEALEALAASCKITSDEELDIAVARAGRALGMASRIEKFWKDQKQYFWNRYQAVNTAIEFGLELNGTVVVGSSRLKAIRDKFESAMKLYTRERDARAAQKQAAVNNIVDSGRREIQQQIEERAAQGDMRGVRELRKDLEAVQPVVIMERPLEVQGAAISEPCVWSLEENGMMALVQAVASGQVPLYHTVRIKGVEENRCIFDLSDPVMNQSVRKLGTGLGWPGIRIERDVKFAIGKV